MAAILCKGIGDLCTGTCKCAGSICEAVCTGPCKLCAGCGSVVADLCSSPFSAFVAVTLVAQVPPIAVGLLELGGFPSCRGSVWLLGAVVLGAINIAAAFYLALRIGNRQDESLQQFRSAYSRASHLLCNDPWIAVYILFYIFFWVWLCLGSAWNWSGLTDEDESCSDTVVGNVRLSVGLGWFFVFGGSMALGASVCCTFCDNRDYGGETTTNGATSNNMNNPTTPSPPFDAENPQPTPPSQQHFPAKQPNVYSPEGVEVDDDGIPVAHAEAIPTPMPPPADIDSKYATASSSAETKKSSTAEPMMPPPSAPPAGLNSSNTASRPMDDQKEGETSGTTAASNVGSSMGKTVGKLFKVDDSKQQALENRGKKAGEAVGKGFTNVKGFVNAKLNNNNKNNNNQMP
jgi:hypothetical protein